MSNRPIAIFDSGVGGLSILRSIHEHLPNENLLYFADSAYSPYGQLEQEALRQRCTSIANFFIKRNAKAMVIACNTATAMMADWLRNEFPVPIIALEPAIKPASEVTQTGHIGVFATENTLASERYLSLLQQYAGNQIIHQSSCPEFVEQVEKGELSNEKTLALVEKYLRPMLKENIDTLVLGCTHYPFLIESFKHVAKNHPLTILDTADAVSLQLTRVLSEHNLLNFSEFEYSNFFTSSNEKQSSQVMSNLLSSKISVKKISF